MVRTPNKKYAHKKIKDDLETHEKRISDGKCKECGREKISTKWEARINGMGDKCYAALIKKMSGHTA